MKIARILSAATAIALAATGLVAASGAAAVEWSDGYGPTEPTMVLGGSDSNLKSPSGLAFDDAGMLYVTNTAGNSVTVYAPVWTALDASPIKVLAGSSTLLDSPVAVAFDADQFMYVVNKSSISVYPADWKGGDTAPTKVLQGDSTGLVDPQGIAFDSIGRMYVANRGGQMGDRAGSITVFDSDWASGNTPPVAELSGSGTGVFHPSSLTFDEEGYMYITNQYGVSVYEPAWDGGDATPVRVLAGPGSGMENPRSIELDDLGYMYVLNVGRGGGELSYITVHDPNWSTGNIKPASAIFFDDWLLHKPQDMALGEGGLAYVSRQWQDSIAAYQTQTLSLDPVSDVPWTTQSVSVSASATSGLPATITTTSPSVCSGEGVSPITVTIKAMGTCTLEVTRLGGAKIAPAPPLLGSFQVISATQTITVSGPTSVSLSKRWTRVKASTTSGLPVVWTSETPDVCLHKRGFGQRVALKATGTCTLSAYQRGNSLWDSAGPETVSFEVTP